VVIDQILFDFIHGLAARSWVVDGIAIFLAQWFPYLLIVIAFYLLFFQEKHTKRRIYLFSYLALSLLVAKGIFVTTIQFFFSRERPFMALDFNPLLDGVIGHAFPSSHTVIFITLALVMFSYKRSVGWWFLLGGFLIGFTRIFVGVHWPLDVAAGIAVAFVSVALIRKLLPNPDMKKPAVSV